MLWTESTFFWFHNLIIFPAIIQQVYPKQNPAIKEHTITKTGLSLLCTKFNRASKAIPIGKANPHVIVSLFINVFMIVVIWLICKAKIQNKRMLYITPKYI